MFFRKFLLLLFAMVFVCGVSVSAHAVPITFAYEGIVNDTFGDPDSAAFDVFLGETIRVQYTFESTTPDNNASANGDYIGAITAMVVTVGSNTYTGNTGNIIITNNDVNPDQYQVYSYVTGPSVGGISDPQLRMIFSDDTNTVYTSDALPTLQPDPSNFPLGIQINLQFADYSGFPEKIGNIIANDNVQISAVPEPTSLLLLGSGLIGLIGLKRKWR